MVGGSYVQRLDKAIVFALAAMLVLYVPRGRGFANILVCLPHLAKEYTRKEVCFSLYAPKADIVSLHRT